MDLYQIQAFFAVLVGICGTVVTVAGLVAVVVKFWKWAHKDTDKNTATLEEFETYLASDKRRIERLEEKQEVAEHQNRLMLKALRSMLMHEIDGNNHREQLNEAFDAIDNYLIEK